MYFENSMMSTNKHIKTLSFKDDEITLSVGQTDKFVVIFDPENATNKNVTWESSDESVATVDQEWNVKAIAPGEATIVAISKDCETSIIPCAYGTVIVEIPVEKVELDKYELIINDGTTRYLNAIVWPKIATDQRVTWESNNPSVATVVEDGKVTGKITAIKPGNATITATTVDGGFKATCDVTVLWVLVDDVVLNITTKLS